MNQTNQQQQVLAILDRCIHLNHLRQLQSFLVSLGHSQTNFYAFKLLRFCALKLSNLGYARSIFDHLKSPNIFLYTAMITAYAAACQPNSLSSSSSSSSSSSFALYCHMVRLGHPKPDQFIFPHVLKSCYGSSKLVHARILKSGFSQYPVVETALIDAYARCGSDIGIARRMFDDMSERNVVSWTAMISGYARIGDIGNAISLFQKMPDRDVPSWNAIIAGCTQNGLFSEAISLFRRMVLLSDEKHSRAIRPNQVTIACVLSACGHTGMLQLGKWIHGYVYRNNSLAPNYFVSNALVDMYGKCGSLNKARKVFDDASKRSRASWNSMINCYALHGQSNNAIRMFEEMMQCGRDVTPDEVTFLGLLNACAHGGLVEEGRFYFEVMTRDYKIEPRVTHYGCLIDILGRAGRLQEALEVVNSMKIEPDEVVWGSLLNGCKIYGHTYLAELAVKKLIEIDPSNGGYRIMLANLYGQLGKWDEVHTLTEVLKEQNAQKTPGCSWIEVDNQVYQFYCVDRSHSRTEEIYKTLELLFGSYLLNLRMEYFIY